MDKIDAILLKIWTKKSELEEILLKSSEIKTRLDAIAKYLPIPKIIGTCDIIYKSKTWRRRERRKI